MNKTVVIALRLALFALLFAAWELLPRWGVVNPALLPPLGDVLAILRTMLAQPAVHQAIGVTAAELAVAFIIAVPLGVALGVLAVERPYFGAVFKPILFYVFSVPKSIFLPVFILAIGIGFHQKVAYAVFQSVFIVVISTMAAVESVQPDHILVARAYGATKAQILQRVYLPSMMPILLEMLRIAMIFNFTGIMIAEMYASRTGLGHLISNWGENYQLPELFAGVILLAGAAIAFNEAVRYLESKWSIWRA
jgi:NitT/TauT family transport system permease protein